MALRCIRRMQCLVTDRTDFVPYLIDLLLLIRRVLDAVGDSLVVSRETIRIALRPQKSKRC
jgi:hypothetical protein